MKRSEMIEEIKYFLVEEGIHSDDVPEWLHDAAKAVLKGIEKAGMVPPAIKDSILRHDDGTVARATYEWEKENA